MNKHILTVAIMGVCAGMSTAAVAGTTTVGGKAYLDITSIDQTSDGSKNGQVKNGFGADAKRFYLGINHGFDNMWSANLTTDFNYISTESQTQLYVKKAFLQARFSDAAVIRIGSADLPWVPFVEGLYGNRYIENTLIDRLKFGTSADWGVHLLGKPMGGMVTYAVSVINGNGYKNPTRSKNMDIEGRISVAPVKNLTLAAGFYSGKLGQDVQGNNTPHTASRTNLVGDYRFGQFNVGVEYFSAKNYRNNLITSSTLTDKADGYSLWASAKLADKVTLFARYDSAKPSKTLNPNLKDTYYNAGVGFKARKNVDIALVYKHEKVENGSINTSNGTIGGTNEGKYSEIGVWTQVKF